MSENRSDSLNQKIEIMAEVVKGIEPPDYVTITEKDRVFWDAIIDTKTGWSKIDLILAANLARCLADIEAIQTELRSEETSLKNDRGTMVANPKAATLESYTRRALGLSVKLQIHARATGEARDRRPKNKAKQEALEAMQDDDEDLIARPKNQC